MKPGGGLDLHLHTWPVSIHQERGPEENMEIRCYSLKDNDKDFPYEEEEEDED